MGFVVTVSQRAREGLEESRGKQRRYLRLRE